MGCPAKNVANKGCGAGLILNPELAVTIIRAAPPRARGLGRGSARGGCRPGAGGGGEGPPNESRARPGRRPGGRSRSRSRPGSVTTRWRWTSGSRYCWAKEPAAISLHGRTLKQMYKGFADWDAIHRAVELARDLPTLILGNGDLKSMSDAVERIRQTGVDGVLLGRGAMGNPLGLSGQTVGQGYPGRGREHGRHRARRDPGGADPGAAGAQPPFREPLG